MITKKNTLFTPFIFVLFTYMGIFLDRSSARFLFQTRVCILYILIIIIIHSSLNVCHFTNLYVYIFSTTLSYIIECTDPFCCYIKHKSRKKYYCYYGISYNNVINESYIFVYINCVKLRDQTKYSLLCIVRECIISTKTKQRVSSSMTFYNLFDA